MSFKEAAEQQLTAMRSIEANLEQLITEAPTPAKRSVAVTRTKVQEGRLWLQEALDDYLLWNNREPA